MRTSVTVALCVLTGCSGGGDRADDSPVETSTSVAASVVSSVASPQRPTPATSIATTTSNDRSSAVRPTTTLEFAVLPEIGVPGLDSDDAFCAAWSRWAGSYQVLLVSNAFGEGGPSQLASLEIVAAPTVVEAFETMFAAWPAELAAERELAADAYLGPITRRLTVAREALAAAGADDAVFATIDDSWLDALARRDPSTPEFGVDLPDEVWSLVDEAAADFSDRLVPFAVDPSLVTEVATPLTDDYLAASCPDRGTLSGQEIDPAATSG